jgi:hypothetical protein
MAARPNTVRTLDYGRRLAANHISRLNEMIEMATRVIDENQLLTPEDITRYHDCIKVGRKMSTLFGKVADLPIPNFDSSTPRRNRGRPSNAELATLQAMREGTKKKGRPKKAVAEAAPKKRGRPAKAKVETTETPKKRGRPPKVTAEATDAAPKRRGRPPKAKTAPIEETVQPKRRGRPPKVQAAPEAPPKKRGRPKGSKNKVKSSNGAGTVAATL